MSSLKIVSTLDTVAHLAAASSALKFCCADRLLQTDVRQPSLICPGVGRNGDRHATFLARAHPHLGLPASCTPSVSRSFTAPAAFTFRAFL